MWKSLFLYLIAYFTAELVNSSSVNKLNSLDVEATQTFYWGPGLNPDKSTSGARYIFLQLVDKDGNNMTTSPGRKIVTSHITGHTKEGTLCHIWTQIFDCKDGSFIVRYRNYNTCFDLQIILQVKTTILPLKHSKFQGPIYEEECYCPDPSVHSWQKNNNCPESYRQINQDLKNFPSVNFDDFRKKLIKTYDKPKSISICHYIIKSNEIYRNCYGEHVGFKTFVDTTLLSLTRKVVLPDVEFFMNLGDWPLVPKNQELYPIFSWCGSDHSEDIVVPTYDIAQSSIEAMAIGRGVTLDMLSVQGNTKWPWHEKISKVFWRGRDSNVNRLKLIDIARENPDLFNVSMTNFFFSKEHVVKKYGPKKEHISFFNFFDYKYQLNIDGTVAAYRFPYLLAGDSIVFKQNSKYYEFFYNDLEPNEHYIPVETELSDLVHKVKWAIANDDKAHKITRRARNYARDNLMPQNIFCYYVTLFEEWSKRLRNSIKVHPGMEKVTQPEHECDCISRDKGEKDEL